MEKIKAFFNNLGFSIRITYQAAHTYFIWKLLLSFACSVLPFVEMYFWKNIINALLEIKKRGCGKDSCHKRHRVYGGVYPVQVSHARFASHRV